MKPLNELYEDSLHMLLSYGEVSSPRGMKIRELRPYIFTLDPHDNIITVPTLETNMAYATEELAWYRSASARIDYSDRIHKTWVRFSDDGVHVNSNYGERIFGNDSGRPMSLMNQWEYVKTLFAKDKDTRQAVININAPCDKRETKDVPCTLDIQYFMRNNKLEQIVHMRSNDAILGFRNDVYCFAELQKQMAGELGIGTGPYTHIANSYHIYERHFDKVRKCITKSQ